MMRPLATRSALRPPTPAPMSQIPPAGRALTVLLLAVLLAAPGRAQVRSGTTAAQFLLIEPDARIAAMGNAGAALAEGAMGAYYNPGVLGTLTRSEAGFSHSTWLADIAYDYGAVAVRFGGTTALLAVTSLNSGEMDVRTPEQPLGTGERFTVQNLALGVGVGRAFSDRFSAGAQVKAVRETVWHSSATAVALDVGVLYRLPVRGAVLGAAVSNFGTRSRFSGRDLSVRFDPNTGANGDNSNLPAALETESQALPIFFRVGLGLPVALGTAGDLALAVDAFQPSDDANSVSLGAEWSYAGTVFARGGFQNLGLPDAEGGLTLGAGLRTAVSGFDVRFDYGWADHGRIGQAQRFTLGLGF